MSATADTLGNARTSVQPAVSNDSDRSGEVRRGADEHLFTTDFLRALEQLELVARKVFRGQMRGERVTRRRGRGLEFSDFRAYQPGDDLRYIDWNVSARLDRMFLKLHAAEEDLSLHVLVDASASMDFGTPSKFDHARRLAAAFAYLGLANLDRISLAAVSERSERLSAGLRGRRRMMTVLEQLRNLSASGATAFGRSLAPLAASIRGRGMVVLVSDLLATDGVAGEDLWRGIGSLRRAGHDVLLLQVLAEEEIDPVIDGAVELTDAETGDRLRLTVDDDLRAAYRNALSARLDEVAGRCRQDGVAYLRLSTAIPVEDLMLRYLRHGAVVR